MTGHEEGYADAPPALPERYRDPVRIGLGGMGEVHRAFDQVLERHVAVKVLAPALAEDGEARRRFSREALAAARLSGHPNVVTIYDVGEWQGRPYLVMEYLAGGTLGARARGAPVPVADALGWLRQAAGALDAAHRAGLVHRDVKPGNLLFDERGQLKVADFGIVRVSDTGASAITRTNGVLGSAGYMAPEQLRGEPVGPPADIYALGIVAYELVTGGRPFGRRSSAAEMSAHLNEPVPPPSQRGVGLPAAVDPVFARALAKEPEARPQTAQAFVDELEAALRPSPREGADAPTRVYATPVAAPPPERRGPSRAVLAGILAAVVLGGGAVAAVVGMGGGEGGAGDAAATPTAPRVVTRTRTVSTPAEVRTVTTATTVPAPAPPAPEPPAMGTAVPSAPASGATPSVAEARRLTDRSYSLILAGDLEGALPLARSAVAGLEGTGDPYEGNALNNMGVILTQRGECEEAVGFLERAQGTGTAEQNRERAANLERARVCARGGSAPAPPPAGDAPGVAQARADTESAYTLIQSGREEEALARQLPALRALEDAGDPLAGNAAYNVGLALVRLDRCGEAVPYLERSQGSGSASQNAIRQETLAQARACR